MGPGHLVAGHSAATGGDIVLHAPGEAPRLLAREDQE